MFGGQTTVRSAAIFGLIASMANAHITITSPVPYGEDTLSKSPLNADGSDFPCKQRSGVYDITEMNNITVGQPQTLSFQGSATHGGGSCQVSISKDTEPTKDSEWKVVHSIIGGCPANASANGSYDPDGVTDDFTYDLPEGLANGEYALAWTWFNHLGNREMYMNCAPITVNGGSSSDDTYNSLPDMFVANIGNGCTVLEGQDYVFPNPGGDVETPVATALGSATSGTCAQATSGPQPSGSATSPASSAAASTSTAASSAQTQLSTSSTSTSTMTTLTTMTSAPIAETTADASATPSATSDSGSSDGGSVACSTQDEIVCIGAHSFGICNNGQASPQALAPGTSCSGGVIQKRTLHPHGVRH